MSDLKSIYLFLKSKGLVKNLKPEYESTPLPSPIPAIIPEPDNPAQAQEVVSKNKKEHEDWLATLSPSDLENFNQIFEQ